MYALKIFKPPDQLGNLNIGFVPAFLFYIDIYFYPN